MNDGVGISTTLDPGPIYDEILPLPQGKLKDDQAPAENKCKQKEFECQENAAYSVNELELQENAAYSVNELELQENAAYSVNDLELQENAAYSVNELELQENAAYSTP